MELEYVVIRRGVHRRGWVLTRSSVSFFRIVKRFVCSRSSNVLCTSAVSKFFVEDYENFRVNLFGTDARIRTTNGDGRFGYVRGQNELPHPWWGWFEGFQLLVRGQSGIQGKHLQRWITLAVQLFGYLPSAHSRCLYLLLPG